MQSFFPASFHFFFNFFFFPYYLLCAIPSLSPSLRPFFFYLVLSSILGSVKLSLVGFSNTFLFLLILYFQAMWGVDGRLPVLSEFFLLLTVLCFSRDQGPLLSLRKTGLHNKTRVVVLPSYTHSYTLMLWSRSL